MAFRDKNTAAVQVNELDQGASAFRCFVASTLIDTPKGPRPVEALQAGDMVSTLDHGPQPVAWVWNGRQPLQGVERGQRPVLICAGALGPGRPTRDLILSPHHRVLVGEAAQFTQRFGQSTLATAQALTNEPGVRTMMGRKAIHWFNFACDRHQVVCANGVLTESLLIEAEALASMTGPERRQIARAFPGRNGALLNGPPARPLLAAPQAGQGLAA